MTCKTIGSLTSSIPHLFNLPLHFPFPIILTPSLTPLHPPIHERQISTIPLFHSSLTSPFFHRSSSHNNNHDNDTTDDESTDDDENALTMIRSRQDSVVRKVDAALKGEKVAQVEQVESDVELELGDGEDGKGDD